MAAAGLNDPHTEPIDSGHSSCESQGSSNWDFVFVPDRGRNSGAVTSRLLEPRHMPGMSPAHSEPHAGSRQCSSAHSEVRRQRRVRCVAVAVCAASSPTPPAGPPESTAWLHLVQIHCVHSVRAGRGALQEL